jgi:hypothetical protein
MDMQYDASTNHIRFVLSLISVPLRSVLNSRHPDSTPPSRSLTDIYQLKYAGSFA